MSTKQKRVRSTEVEEFDISKYVISNDVETHILIIPETRDKLEIKVRSMPWSKRNKIISECLKWQEGGQVDFDGDRYVRTCLQSMIVEAPWGITDEKFLLSIDARLGSVLEAIVPKAFNDDQGEEIETIKKV